MRTSDVSCIAARDLRLELQRSEEVASAGPSREGGLLLTRNRKHTFFVARRAEMRCALLRISYLGNVFPEPTHASWDTASFG